MYKPAKVYSCLLDYEDLEKISNDCNDYWADYDDIINHNLQDYIDDFMLEALKNGECDYIAFRLNN